MFYVFDDSIEESENENPEEANIILLEGTICKTPVLRATPSGWEIADIFLKVDRPYGKSDYFPCIAWGRNAKYATTIEPGTALKIKGRVQSRDYVKTIGDEKIVKTAYEVSISLIDIIE